MATKPPSDDDKALFQQAVSDVIPLKSHDKHHFHSKKLNKNANLNTDINNTEPLHNDFTPVPPNIRGEDYLSFHRIGIQHRTLKKLKKGLIPIEASLDLHGDTILEAAQHLAELLANAEQESWRCIHIIHGKGREKNGFATLKSQINTWLREHPATLAFYSSQPQDGGTGAIYLFLKRESP